MFKIGRAFSKIKDSLKMSAAKLNDGIINIFSNKKLDNETIEELEDFLITTDMGYEVARKIIDKIAMLKFKQDITTTEIKEKILEEITKILKPVEQTFEISESPHVVVLCGINGNGKTTSIGKLAYKLTSAGKKVMIAQCDTFRAAASEQLQVWAERSNSIFIQDQNAKDPASIAYKAMKEAKERNVDVLFIDTAGRLHTQKNLMDELKKISTVIKKIDENAPHHILLALDATTGQNALNQIKIFKEMINISGLIITKLDGTAKGGIVINIADAYPDLKIYLIGTGENIDDIEEFNVENFGKNILNL